MSVRAGRMILRNALRALNRELTVFIGMQRPYNISLYPGQGSADGRRGDHILLAPAYNVTSDEIRQVVEVVTTVVERYFDATASLALHAVATPMKTVKEVLVAAE